METDTNAATNWHTVVPATLGRPTLVRDEGAPRGLSFHQLGSDLIMRVADELLLERRDVSVP